MRDQRGMAKQIDFAQIVAIGEDQLRLFGSRCLAYVLVFQFVAVHARTMVAAETVGANLAARSFRALVDVFAQVPIFVTHFESGIASAFVANLNHTIDEK